MSSIDELRVRLDLINAPYMDVRVAMMPVKSFDTSDPSLVAEEQKRINLETRLGVCVLIPDNKSEFSHQTYCDIAREVGRRVEHDLLQSSCWRTGI